MTSPDDLTLATRAADLLAEVVGDDAGGHARAALERFRSKCGEHVRVAVSGTSSAGKSELVNALFGDDGLRHLLPTDPDRTSINVACLRFGPGLAPASWVEWMTADEAEHLLTTLEAHPEAGAEAAEMRAVLDRRLLGPQRWTTPVAPDELGAYLDGGHPEALLVRRVVVERPIEGSVWADELDEPIRFELVDLPGHGTEVIRDAVLNHRELDAIETVLFVVDKPQAVGTGPIIDKMRELLRATADRRPEQRVLPVLNKFDSYLAPAVHTRWAQVEDLQQRSPIDLESILEDLGIAGVKELQRRLGPRGAALPLLTVAVDGFAPSPLVGPEARRALAALGEVAARLLPGENRERLLAVALGSGPDGRRVPDGGIGHLRRAILEHARDHGARALARDRAEAALTLASELGALPDHRADDEGEPMAIVNALHDRLATFDIAAEVVDRLRPTLWRGVTGQVCGWPFWRTAITRLEGGVVPPNALSDGRSSHLHPPSGETGDEVLLPRRPEELEGWYLDAFRAVAARVVGEQPPSGELRRACIEAWEQVEALYQQVAAGRPSWAEAAGVHGLAAAVARELAREVADGLALREKGGALPGPGVPRLPVNPAIRVLPWARSGGTQEGQSYAQPRHLAILAYERLTLIEAMVGQLAATVAQAVRQAALSAYARGPERDQVGHGPVPLSSLRDEVLDLEKAVSAVDPSGPTLSLVNDLHGYARKERDRADLP